MATVFQKTKFFENWAEYLAQMPWGSKISTKSLHLAPLRRYRHFVFLLKIQNGHHFSKDKKFWKKWVPCSDALGVENFDEIALSCSIKEIQAFCVFAKNSKRPPFFERQQILEKWGKWVPCSDALGLKVSTKPLYLAPLRRYRQFCVIYSKIAKIAITHWILTIGPPKW